MAANLYFSSVLRIFIHILQKIFKENLASADKCYVLHFYLCAINKERKMKIKTMIVALGISFVMLGNTVFSSEGYLGLQADRGADGSLVIKRVVNGSVAGYAGLKPKDRIIKINGVDLEGLSYERSKNLLKGEAGQPVSIVVEQNGKLKEMKLVRSHNKNGIISISNKPKPIKKTPIKKHNSKIVKTTNENIKSPEAIKQKISSGSNKQMGYGIFCIKDPYNKKVIVASVIENSPADKAGIKIGNEVIKVNNKKAKRIDLEDLFSYNKNYIKIKIRDNYNDKKTIKLTLGEILIPQVKPIESDTLLNVYWQQLTPVKWEHIQTIHPAIYNRLSRKAKNDQDTVKYWYDKKIKFYSGYNACKLQSAYVEDLNKCMADLVKTEKNIIEQEQERAHEMRLVTVQRQISILNASALFSHAFALMNQRVDVNHSGTINHDVNHYGNVNHDVNLRGRMNVYHY